jgi:hypothetical protein
MHAILNLLGEIDVIVDDNPLDILLKFFAASKVKVVRKVILITKLNPFAPAV